MHTGSLSVALLIVIGLVLLSGHGAWMIAGYNTSSKEEKAKYDEKALCRFIGKLILGLAACMILGILGSSWQMTWLLWLGPVLGIGVAIGGILYANTGNRFKK